MPPGTHGLSVDKGQWRTEVPFRYPQGEEAPVGASGNCSSSYVATNFKKKKKKRKPSLKTPGVERSLGGNKPVCFSVLPSVAITKEWGPAPTRVSLQESCV